MFPKILAAYNLNTDDCTIAPFGSGLINHTWKIRCNDEQYILQCINIAVFKSPQAIADNLLALQKYLHATTPGYLFPTPLSTSDNTYLVIDDGRYYRLLPFVKNSHSVDVATEPSQAFEAARQFGKFSRLLNDFDASQLKYTLPDFHNLSLRAQQFQSALKHADQERLNIASTEIEAIKNYQDITQTYVDITKNATIPLRVIHHDTKINNVLFDADDKGLCVIDLDTVMPGYYISDAGDMMRTYLSPANEEEQELDKVCIREDYLKAIHDGYMSEMRDVLTPAEKALFYYSGKFMIYMQAMRFLTDYLNNDIYYHTTYPGQNLKRAQNQLRLLSELMKTYQRLGVDTQ
ncbi:aminoglycoside phosphotransferase family protein [Mucilaginibacter panaciglaebae]|uniref:Phosphotransferase n=1 Tax=Mucilaginibacter panaciglaebae TaxID=502331 RepID=A0ABP7WZR5_9SPHI